MHQGHRPLAVPQGRARPLARLERDAPGRADAARAGADRRRQPRSAAGMGVARERLRPCDARGRQRSRPRALHRGRDHRRRHAPARAGRSERRRQCRGDGGPQRRAGRGDDRLLPARAGLPAGAGQSAQARLDRRRDRQARAHRHASERRRRAIAAAVLAAPGEDLARQARRRRPGLPDRPRHRAGDPRRPRRYRHRDAFGGQFRRARFRVDRVGAVRPGDAPARLLPPRAAGAAQVPAFGRARRARAGNGRLRFARRRRRAICE